jgi:hypothetical protein
MAVAELTGFRRFEVKDYVRETPKPGEVQVRMAAVGICGSDLHHFIDGHIGDPRASSRPWAKASRAGPWATAWPASRRCTATTANGA